MSTIIKRNRVNITSIEGINIFPGVNQFSDEQVKTMEINPAWKGMISNGTHTVISAPAVPVAPVSPEKGSAPGAPAVPVAPVGVLSALSNKDAKKVIEETYSLESLQAMQDEEEGGKKRAVLLNAIQKQIETVSSKGAASDGK